MNCPICDVELDPTWTKREFEGITQWVDENGVIRHNHLDSERAKQIGKRGGATLTREQKSLAEKLGDSLVELVTEGLDAEKAESLEVWLRQIAKASARDSSASLKGVELAINLMGAIPRARPPLPGERCPLCKRKEQSEIQVTIPESIMVEYYYEPSLNEAWNALRELNPDSPILPENKEPVEHPFLKEHKAKKD